MATFDAPRSAANDLAGPSSFSSLSMPPPTTTTATTAATSAMDSAGGGAGRTVFAASSHPWAAFFHVFFRVSALLVYLFCSLFTDDFVVVFVVVVLLLSVDFWTVKNVTGRLLVGLRWWNEVKEDGTNVWIFESRQDGEQGNAFDSRIFWYSLYITPVVWVLFAIIALIQLSFSWLLVVAVAVMLSIANAVGYVRCQRDAARKRAAAAGTGDSFFSSSGVAGAFGRMVSQSILARAQG